MCKILSVAVVLAGMLIPSSWSRTLQWAPTPQGPWLPAEDAVSVIQDGYFFYSASTIEPNAFFRLLLDNGQFGSPVRIRPTITMEFEEEAPETAPGMVLVPEGEFEMGDVYKNGEWDESPLHKVFIDAFFIGIHQITRDIWYPVRDWGRNHGYAFTTLEQPVRDDIPIQMLIVDVMKWCNAKSEMEGLTPCYYADEEHSTPFRVGLTDDALNNESWVDWEANGYRLPTEAEWEKAARGKESAWSYFPWNSLGGSWEDHIEPSYACYGNNSKGPVPVGSFMANSLGIYDMAGNVWEWCWDNYNMGFYKETNYSQMPNTKGPTYNFVTHHPSLGSVYSYNRVVRGGAWDSDGKELRCANRKEERWNALAGFRLVRRAILGK